MRNTVLFLLAASLVGGCASNDKNSVAGQKAKNAAASSLSQPKLDASKDPPITAETRHAAGALAESQGQVERAVVQYREAIKADPKHQPSLYRLGILLTQAKQYPQAIETWKQYIRATNGAAEAYSNAAFCFELAGKKSEAEECYKLGIKKDPTNQPCRMNYGLMLARANRVKDAIEQLSAILQPAEVHYNLASVFEQLGKKDQAKAEYERALQLDPQLWEASQRLSKLD